MKDFIRTVSTTKTSTYDAGLRNYMNGVYKNMSFALAITAVVSFIFGNTQLINLIITPPINFIVMFAPLIFVMFFSAKINKLTGEQARNYLMIFASIMGLSLSSIFIIYTGTSIVRTFLVTSITFGAMSLYGYTTKKDLTGMGSFLIMGLFGLIIAMIVNLFLRSAGMEFALSILGVLIFTGLTAYDVQKIKRLYFTVSGSKEAVKKVAIMGALNLYLDFINLFLFLLRFMGGGRNN